MLNKLFILFRSLYGYMLKWAYDLRLMRVPALGKNRQADVIVSLTSYGRRVQQGVVCYSIYSILRQTIQPKRIILWLSETEWDDSNLPHNLSALREKGVEIRYCKDMKSYKKLLPTIALCPDEQIVTIDDDIIYPKRLIHELWQEHKARPTAVIATHAYAADTTKAYSQWSDAQAGSEALTYFAVGAGGILYPAHSLKAEMMHYELAIQYAPHADDVWFWAASIAANTVKRKTSWQYKTVSFDAIYQTLHIGSALQHSNVKGHALTNDMQLAKTLQFMEKQHGIG